ncbi:hypothetical protein LGK97_07060 [Clostridium sp. CS001]|uniref:hypothetical protein n=1 Tax=Clostridium sp. CS001 TaxID=2880648 RepID=UPI001CF3ABE2|nr:hypothetical protein [Clostridium sp. CS001]MCB2289524.1 hypothetical protein [Clostridium sp. CS001]
MDNEVKDMLVKILEGQSRLEDKVNALIEGKMDLLETNLKSVCKNGRELNESVDVMKDILGRHEMDIEILKRRTV